MRISEAFYTLQGEGTKLGKPAIFLRIAGCNLRCHWCDTPYASWKPKGPHLSVDQCLDLVNEQVEGNGVPRSRIEVVITGGEPMIYAKELAELIPSLQIFGYQVTIETAGTKWHDSVKPDLWSVSPKLNHSAPDPELHPREHRKHVKNNQFQTEFASLNNAQFKFVVRHDHLQHDIAELRQYCLDNSIPHSKVILMPEGQTKAETMAAMEPTFEACMKYGYTMCPRLHVIIYGSKRGV